MSTNARHEFAGSSLLEPPGSWSDALPSVEAVSISPAAVDWLRRTRAARVLHAFDKACNLVDQQGEVVSVVDREIGNGPFNIVVRERLQGYARLTLPNTVAVSPAEIDLCGVRVRIADARLWSPRPDWERLHANRDRVLRRLDALPIDPQPSHLPGRLLAEVAAGVGQGAASACLPLIPRLAGLGIGLTPAGDDFLVGAMYAARILHRAEAANELAGAIAALAAPLTTTLSAAWLRAAGRGEAGESWHALFHAVLIADSQAERAAVGRILATGETSGADALAGLAAVLRCRMELESPHVVP